MDEHMALKHSADKRLASSLDDGPPGVDGTDASEKNEEIAGAPTSRKNSKSKSTSRRRSNSRHASPPMRRRRSHSRSPTPPPQRRGRYDSPDYGRYGPRRRFDRRRSPDRDRRRSPPRRGRRYGRSRSRSRSISPPRRGGGGRGGSPPMRWSPKKKPVSPPPVQQLGPPAGGYGVMPGPMYGAGPYGGGDVYGHQYGMAPPNAFPPQGPPPGYAMQGPPPGQAPGFNTGYGAWVVNEYGQQVWMPQPMASVPPTVPEGMGVQQAALVVPVPQLEQPQQQAIIEEQPPPALESAGLPAQDAVAQEAENQKDELKKQRTNYIKKVSLLKKEMKVLKEQRNDLTSGEAPPSPTTKNFIEENDRLQVQIKKKLDTIENVIDMLNGIIGDEEAEEEQEETPKSQPEQSNSKSGQATGTSTTSDSSADSFDSSSSSSSSSDSSSEAEGEADNDNDTNSPTDRLKACAIQSMKAKQAAASKQADPAQNCNLVFFDPEQHWCESCNAFPKTARDYLKHLHAEEHMNRETVETPWHVGIDHDPFPTIDKAPVKRVPVRGLQFLVPASAWYCKLCSVWIGDLHCASAHLKSRMHANRYDLFLKKQPNYESEWHSKREKAQQQQKESEEVKQKKADEKVSKKRKKKSSDKKKKKRKHSKKHKRNATSTSSSTADSSSSDEEEHSKQQPKKEPVDAATATINAASIRVAMRKQEGPQEVAQPQVAPPPPPIIKDAFNADKRGKWTSSANEDGKVEEQKKRDDAMLQQWNPVISESEKKIIEDLKGKLKNKLRPGAESKSNSSAAVEEKPKRALSKRRSNSRGRSDRSERERRDRERDRERERDRDRDRERERRDRERDRDRERRRVRSSRSRSRGNRRSRSRDTRRRRSRSRQRSEERVERVERPVVKHSEFRPRAQPAPAKSTEPKKEKKEPPAKPKSTSAGGKKLPFIGKMPVLKKQPTVAPAIAAGYAEAAVYTNGVGLENAGLVPPPPPPPGGMSMSAATRAAAPTAAQIQMAMMEDVYGNAPPFHPDAGMMMDYDELMPDPVQFANLMTNCPPPPPPGGDSAGASSLDAEQMQEDAAEEDVLPPGIDEVEPDHMSQPLATTTATEDDGVLPQDFAEALDIIFPTERAGDEEADGNSNVNNVPQTITTIVEDEPVLDEQNLHDLAKQGIHLVSIDGNAKRSSIDEQLMEESSQTLDEAPALPLVNGNAATPQQIPMPATPPPPATTTTTEVAITTELKLKEREQLQLEVGDIPQPPDSPTDSEKLRRQAELEELAMLGIDSSDMAAQYAL